MTTILMLLVLLGSMAWAYRAGRADGRRQECRLWLRMLLESGEQAQVRSPRQTVHLK